MAKDKQKIHFSLTAEALDVVARRAPSAGKRGEWISAALVDYDRILAGVPENEPQLGTLETMADRLGMIEKQLSLVVRLLGKEGVRTDE